MHPATLFVVCLTALTCVTSTQGQCVPGDNCNPPDCRCWNDFSVPGGFDPLDVPQVVLITFQYAISTVNEATYLRLFEGFTNPNNCPAVGTFYVQSTNTDFTIVKELSDLGFEIGITTADGTVPQSEADWRTSLTEVRDAVVASGVPAEQITGFRAPSLQSGGDPEFSALAVSQLQYDASCSTTTYDQEANLLWPYTYDFPADAPLCNGGSPPITEYPGIWQFTVPDLQFNGVKCATPPACTGVLTQRDVFNLFYDSFVNHYQGRRTPFVIIITPDWLLEQYRMDGTRQFLQFIRAAFEDTWILTTSQSLEWIKNPVSNANTTDYAPWSCAGPGLA